MKKKPLLAAFKKQLGYHVLVWPALILTLIFCYIPMGGIIIAFKDYRLRTGIIASPWAGFGNFKNIFDDPFISQIVMNTLGIGILRMLVFFPIVLSFVMLLNELRVGVFKRVVQTVSYLPHFISWAIVAVIITAMFSPSSGAVNRILLDLKIIREPFRVLTSLNGYWWLAIFTEIWMELGWSAIIYLAVLSGIDEAIYEAAKIDGAGRFARMWHISLPSLKGIIAIMLIMTVSGIPNVGFNQAYFLSNNLTLDRAKTLSYHIYSTGIVDARFSYSTAISLVLSVISAALMVMANTASKKLTDRGLY